MEEDGFAAYESCVSAASVGSKIDQGVYESDLRADGGGELGWDDEELDVGACATWAEWACEGEEENGERDEKGKEDGEV